jgi:hypothetical protein
MQPSIAIVETVSRPRAEPAGPSTTDGADVSTSRQRPRPHDSDGSVSGSYHRRVSSYSGLPGPAWLALAAAAAAGDGHSASMVRTLSAASDNQSLGFGAAEVLAHLALHGDVMVRSDTHGQLAELEPEMWETVGHSVDHHVSHPAGPEGEGLGGQCSGKSDGGDASMPADGGAGGALV